MYKLVFITSSVSSSRTELYNRGGKGGGNVESSLGSKQFRDNIKIINLPKLLSPRSGHIMVVVNDLIYVIGGRSINERMCHKIEVFNPQTYEWSIHELSENSYIPTPRYLFSHSLIAEKYLFIFGGIDKDQNHLSDVDCFNFESNSWMSLPSLSIPRYGSVCFAVDSSNLVDIRTNNFNNNDEALAKVENNHNHIINNNNHISDIDTYSDEETINNTPPLPKNLYNNLRENRRKNNQIVKKNSGANNNSNNDDDDDDDVLNFDLIICGGSTESNVSISSVEIYNTKSNTWKSGIPLLYPTCGSTSCVIDNRYLFNIGGNCENENNFTYVQIFDNLKQNWLIGPSLNRCTISSTLSVIHNSLFVIGGISIDEYTNNDNNKYNNNNNHFEYLNLSFH
eukprot:TRINITY_DN1575_c0_g1_i1.p1 TRINITY_DN1575_c0_g1~~TRINITY_DN1575_c0_g1_i1.p1  ORF type:complete len:395 (+),score=104.84 TRINITY_DN1575_c0_g1_i1:113-1297(+)